MILFSFRKNLFILQHFPLKFSVRYNITSDQNYTLLYTGLHTELNFSLPAGDANRNYTSKYIQFHSETVWSKLE